MRVAFFVLAALSLFLSTDAFSQNAAPKKRTFLHSLDRFLTRLQNPQEQLKHHTYLTGNYAPVTKEHVHVPVEVVEGKIPRSLNGMVVRNGPNPDPALLEKRYSTTGLTDTGCCT